MHLSTFHLSAALLVTSSIAHSGHDQPQQPLGEQTDWATRHLIGTTLSPVPCLPKPPSIDHSKPIRDI